MNRKMALGWAGIGKMGSPMSRRVLAAGYQLTVFDPVAANRAEVAAEGAAVAHALAELADAADVIFVTVPNDHVLGQIVFGPDGLGNVMKPGQVLVDMSTVSPMISSEVAACLAAKEIGYLRAPVSGSTATASSGTLTVMVSGDEAICRRLEPIFSCFTSRLSFVGTGEEARYLKLVINSLVGATSALLGEALAFGRKGGLTIETMLDVIGESAVASPLIAYKRDMLVSGDFDPAFTVSQMMKDFDLILDAAKGAHAPMYLASLVRQHYEAAWAGGSAEKDFFVLSEHYARLAGLQDAR